MVHLFHIITHSFFFTGGATVIDTFAHRYAIDIGSTKNDIIKKERWLICGSRSKKSYKDLVFKDLDKKISVYRQYLGNSWKPEYIVEGECPDSADVYARAWAEQNNINVKPFRSEKGSFLKRNIEMVKFADKITAYWNGFSYGAAHTIAQGILQCKPVTVMEITYC